MVKWRITHVVPALTRGGGERVAVDLANHAARVGHVVTMICGFRADPKLLATELYPSVKVLYVSNVDRGDSRTIASRARPYVRLVPWLVKHRAWLASQDVIHCHLSFGEVFGSAIHFVRWFERQSTPVVIETYHSVGMPLPTLQRALQARMAMHRDGFALMAEDGYWRSIIASNPSLLTRIIPNGVNASPSAIDAAARLAYRRLAGVPDECRLVMGTVGRLDPDRQPWRYVPIFARVARELPDVHFVMAGAGSELERVRHMAVQAGLANRIHFPGLVVNPRLAHSIMDLYVTMNVGPITGLAALEAIISGVPVIAIQMLREYRSTTDWISSSPDDDVSAALALTLLRSPEERRQLVERQHAHVLEHNTTDVMARAYYALYQEALVKRLPGGESPSHQHPNAGSGGPPARSRALPRQ